MMNKRIIILFTCLLLLIIPIVLFSAVFVVRHVDVEAGIDDEFDFDATKLIGDSRISMGSSIFILSEKNVRHNIELKNPDIKVINVERIFPNRVVISVDKRIPMVAVSIKNTSKYALVDRELRVVEIVDDIATKNVVYYEGYSLDIANDATLDNTIIDLDKKEIGGYVLDGIIKGFEAMQRVNDMLRSDIVSITTDFANGRAFINTTAGASIEILIKTDSTSIEDFVIGGVGAFNRAYADGSDDVLSGVFYNDRVTGWLHRD